MSFFQHLYTLLIGPLELFFDVIYALAYRYLGNQGSSIVILSLVMNFLVLPLYRRADALQAEEAARENALRPWADHIKKTFRGDERFMLLQTYYRQNGYKPTQALRGSLSLLLEIPFFIAAYRFLSSLELLHGVSFGLIRDLGAPDALLHIGGLAVNVLPFLMTGINVISGAVYTRGMPMKSKLQLYGMALIFLVLLYNSPAGLVFYWTLNNLFSLCKNIFYRLKNPRRVLALLCSLSGITLLALPLLRPGVLRGFLRMAALGAGALLQLPLGMLLLHRLLPRREPPALTGQDKRVFYLGCAVLTVLTGLLIPSALLKGSAAEFVYILDFHSPLRYVLSSLLLATGTFMVWGSIFFGLADDRGKRVFGYVMLALTGAALIDYMAFGERLGNISSLLVLDVVPRYGPRLMLINLLILSVTAAVLFLLWRFRRGAAALLLMSVLSAVTMMSGVNVAAVSAETREIEGKLDTHVSGEPTLRLSSEGKNVVVIMLDRALASFTPYIFHEHPELKSQFDGFTYYPRTLSFGFSTNTGSPPIYGGYGYTPEEMNRRDTLSLKEKQNQALKVMPILFDEKGYEVTICDPTYAGYDWIPDLSVFRDYPQFNTYLTQGRYSISDEDLNAVTEHMRHRNIFCYSVMKIAPLCLHRLLYNYGGYLESNQQPGGRTIMVMDGLSKSTGIDRGFSDAYAVLKSLGDLTALVEEREGAFIMLSNNTTHQPQLLQTPDYLPAMQVDNTDYDRAHAVRETDDGRSMRLETEVAMTHYHANMASMLLLGQWFDQLRELGVYDNTRIILVADHGRDVGQFSELLCQEIGLDIMHVNPLLMVKDFDSTGFSTDESFMTNADVPSLAMEGLIESPADPFTGLPIDMEPKNASEFRVLHTNFDITVNNGNTFAPGTWYVLRGDMLQPESWSVEVE